PQFIGPRLPEFQSPRRWGGVGLILTRSTRSSRAASVSIPSEVGRGRAPCYVVRDPPAAAVRFNPLGGGAGAGSKELRPGGRGTAAVCFNPLGGGAGSGSHGHQL